MRETTPETVTSRCTAQTPPPLNLKTTLAQLSNGICCDLLLPFVTKLNLSC